MLFGKSDIVYPLPFLDIWNTTGLSSILVLIYLLLQVLPCSSVCEGSSTPRNSPTHLLVYKSLCIPLWVLFGLILPTTDCALRLWHTSGAPAVRCPGMSLPANGVSSTLWKLLRKLESYQNPPSPSKIIIILPCKSVHLYHPFFLRRASLTGVK